MATPHASARPKNVRQVTWEGLSEVVGKKIRVVMPDGTLIQGRAKRLEVDGLAVDIQRTSNEATFAKGSFLLPRATLRAVDVAQHSALYGQIIGATLGGALGFLCGAGAANSSGAEAVGLGALAVGLPVTGYFLGRAADRRVTTYVIAPQ